MHSNKKKKKGVTQLLGSSWFIFVSLSYKWMKEMSFSRKRDVDLTGAYDRSLERQIVEQGSSLPCRDEELWRKVEGLMKEGNAQEIHCLGVDPLRVMEESLKAVTAAGWSRQVGTRGGLQGLAKAFEVLEQAALNLYLGPWRKEYTVIQVGQKEKKVHVFS